MGKGERGHERTASGRCSSTSLSPRIGSAVAAACLASAAAAGRPVVVEEQAAAAAGGGAAQPHVQRHRQRRQQQRGHGEACSADCAMLQQLATTPGRSVPFRQSLRMHPCIVRSAAQTKSCRICLCRVQVRVQRRRRVNIPEGQNRTVRMVHGLPRRWRATPAICARCGGRGIVSSNVSSNPALICQQMSQSDHARRRGATPAICARCGILSSNVSSTYRVCIHLQQVDPGPPCARRTAFQRPQQCDCCPGHCACGRLLVHMHFLCDAHHGCAFLDMSSDLASPCMRRV